MDALQKSLQWEKLQESRIVASSIMRGEHSLHPPNISEGLSFDEQRMVFTPKPCEDFTIQFQAVFDRLQRIEPDIASLDLKKTATWDDVYDAINRAKREYKHRGTSIRKMGRRIGDAGPAITEKLDHGPDEMYIGVVCKGLQLVFNIAAHIASKRNQILETFESIPERVKRMQKNDRFYSRDPDYRARREDFDSYLLMSIAKCTQWLLAKPKWKIFEATLKGPLATKPVEDLIKTLQQKTSDLQLCMEHQDKLRWMRTAEDVEGLKELQGVHKATIVGKIDDQGRQQSLENSAIIAKMDDQSHQQSVQNATILARIDDQDQYLRERLEKESQERQRVNLAAAEACNGLFCILAEGFKKINSQRAECFETSQRHISSLEPVLKVIYQDELAKFMKIPENMDIQNLLEIVEVSTRFDAEEMMTGQTVFRCDAFKEWFTSSSRGIFYLNGSGNLDPERISPISALLGSLVTGLADDPTVILLYSFCGLLDQGPVQGPAGLMRSLINQIIITQGFDLDFITPDRRTKFRNHDVVTLCETFLELTYQVPAEREILIIVDGTSWLETSEWEQDLLLVLEYLFYLDVAPDLSAKYGLLVTSPSGSWKLVEHFRSCSYAPVVEIDDIDVMERDMPLEREAWDLPI